MGQLGGCAKGRGNGTKQTSHDHRKKVRLVRLLTLAEAGLEEVGEEEEEEEEELEEEVEDKAGRIADVRISYRKRRREQTGSKARVIERGKCRRSSESFVLFSSLNIVIQTYWKRYNN